MKFSDQPLLSEKLSAHGSRIAIIDDSGQYSYSSLSRRAEKVTQSLLNGRRDLYEARIAFRVSPGVEYVAVLLGIWRAGGIAVPLGLQYPLAELDYFVGDAEPEVVISDRDHAEHLENLTKRRKIPLLRTESLPSVPPSPLPEVGTERRAMILYTSGATGKPKGVVTTHSNISAQIRCLVKAWEWTAEDHVLHVLPLHHVHGIINVLCCALWVGATCRMLPRFDPSRVFDSFVGEKVTTFMAVPTVYAKLISAWEAWGSEQRQQFSTACFKMRLMVSGSAALPVSIAEKWRQISGHTLLERYGMTEIGMALSNPLHGERRLGTVGKPLPGVEVRIRDSKGRTILKEGLPGEIWVRSESVFKEYWNQQEITEGAFHEGWFQTGDVAVIEDGYFRILGRRSVDIIKTGGYKVSALEVEEVLRRHPGIRECAVIGIEDEEWGERVSSVVVLEPGQSLDLKGLRHWATDKLVTYKIPSLLLLVDDLPRNALGKVRKPELKKLFPRGPESIRRV